MRSDSRQESILKYIQNPPPTVTGIALAVIWLVFISLMHFKLNAEKFDSKVINMGYMPVITNLAAPLLDKASKNRPDISFNAIKFASFADMAEALRNNQIHVAFMIAPLAIVLHQQDEDIRIILIGNRHESTLVARKGIGIEKVEDLQGKTVAVPMRYSGHYLSLMQMINKAHLQGKVNIVEMNPPDMPSAITAKAIDAYYVGEPFAAQALQSGEAKLLHYVEDVWPGFICNLVVVKKELIDRHPDTVRLMVEGAVRSGIWAKQNCSEAAKIASIYWNQPYELILYALDTPPGRIIFNRYIPKMEELQFMADQMVAFGLIDSPDIDNIIDDRFAREADTQAVTGLASILE